MGKVWIEGHVELLIETMRTYEKLWNTKHPRYTNSKKARHRLWKELTKLFNDAQKETEYTSWDVQYKWNNLRLKFQKEHQKLADLKKSNSSWRYYNSLVFLTAHPSRKREVRFDNLKRYSLRKAEKTGSDTEVSVGSISPRNRRNKEENQNTSINQEISTNDARTDEETDYVSIGSVSPPYYCDNDGQDFCIKDEL